MGMYQYVRDAWKKPSTTNNDLWRERLIAWRKEDSVVKIEHPTRIDRARSLGFKAKQGYIVVRQRVVRGQHIRPQIKSGRRPKRSGTRMNLRKNYQQIAEERAQKEFPNLVVLNSYWVAQDGRHYWYEIILVDPNHPVIKADQSINWIGKRNNPHRVFYGKTSAGKRGRGLQA